MSFDTPLSTAWPAGLTGLVLLVSLFKVRRRLRPTSAMLLFVVAALVLRLWFIPGLDGHIYDGHEADYYDLFRGVLEPSRGGTVLVPAMQWFWWLAGQVLPREPWVPVVLMALAGVAAIGLVAGSIDRLAGRPAAILAAVLLALHPTHVAWSSSAYNVMLPHLLLCLALYATARFSTSAGPPGAFGWVAASSAALAVGMRMDTASVGLVLVAWSLWIRPDGVGIGQRLRSLLLPGVAGLGLAALCLWPLLWPGELPGAGERGLSFAINLGFFAPYAPFEGLVGITVIAVAAVAACKRALPVAVPLVAWIVVHHLLLASFDDFGTRHVMSVLPALVGLVGIAAAGVLGRALVAVVALLCLVQLADLRDRFYGDEAAFASVLSTAPWDTLKRVNWPEGVDPSCGWVVEDHRVRRGRMASHFNLIRPEEEQALRGRDGCLRWCVDVQDWRWSSRSVRDRALRISHLFELQPAFVVEHPSTGYACVAMDVGPRQVGVSASDHESRPPIDHRIP